MERTPQNPGPPWISRRRTGGRRADERCSSRSAVVASGCSPPPAHPRWRTGVDRAPPRPRRPAPRRVAPAAARLPPPETAHPFRRRPQDPFPVTAPTVRTSWPRTASFGGHPLQHRLGQRSRRGRAPDHHAHRHRHFERVRSAGGRRRLPVALRPRGSVLHVLPGRHERELPPRRPGDRRRGTGHLHQHVPACYDGRWPHAHFEVYPDVAAATGGRSKITTSQLALPEDVCSTVYATDGYSSSVSSLSRVSLASDNVFGDDGGVHELATVTGSVAQGYTATLAVPV